MIHARWKLGAGVAMLALGVWAVPAALSSFSADTSFSTEEPVSQSDGAGFAADFTVDGGTFQNVTRGDAGDAAPASNFRLSMDGTIASVGGVGDSVGNYSGDYSITADEELISAGTFDLQATSSLTGGDVLLNAQLSEQAGSGALADADGLLTLSAVSTNGSSFNGGMAAGGSISSDPTGGSLRGLAEDDLSCLALLEGLLCDHHGDEELDMDELLDRIDGNEASEDGPVVVPEPASLALLGLLGAGAMVRRGPRRRQHA